MVTIMVVLVLILVCAVVAWLAIRAV